MNIFSCNYQILRTLLLPVLLLAAGGPGAAVQISAQGNSLKVIKLTYDGKIDEQDTLLAGAYRVENEARLNALGEELVQLSLQRLTEHETEELEKLEKMFRESSSSASNQKAAKDMQMIRDKIAATEKAPDSQLAYAAKSRNMSVAEYRSKTVEGLRKMLESYEQGLAQANTNASRVEAQVRKLYDILKQKQAATTAIVPKMYAVKRRIAALMVDGKLHNYVDMRDFRHGRAAVAIRERYYSEGQRLWTYRNVWGFVDEQMRPVIPCLYERVFDFNNYKNYRSQGVFEKFYDRDDRPWTTVFPKEYGGVMMGMIDRDGREVIPVKFICHEAHHMWIEFFKTPWGEFAPVTVLITKGKYLEGIIDRNGNYTLQPSYKHLVWYDDLQCFGTTGDNRIYFDPYGNKIEH